MSEQNNNDPNKPSNNPNSGAPTAEWESWISPNTEAWLLAFLRAVIREKRSGERHEPGC